MVSGGIVKERYAALPLGTNSSTVIKAQSIGGFLAITGGTITVTQNTDVNTSVTIINAFPVAAGVYYPLPFFLGTYGGSVTLAGGASGVLGV